MTNLNGNPLPSSPKHSVHLGLSYSWYLAAGAFTARWDYYWQDTSYLRTYKSRFDRIDSWEQHNASLAFESSNSRWAVRAWIRNIGNEDIVTGGFTGQLLARGYFLAEPRIYGLSVRYNFGVP